MAELRDPKRRLVHELLAALPVGSTPPKSAVEGEIGTRWPEAPMVFGYGPVRKEG
jgi:hypothetical protein